MIKCMKDHIVSKVLSKQGQFKAEELYKELRKEGISTEDNTEILDVLYELADVGVLTVYPNSRDETLFLVKY